MSKQVFRVLHQWSGAVIYSQPAAERAHLPRRGDALQLGKFLWHVTQAPIHTPEGVDVYADFIYSFNAPRDPYGSAPCAECGAPGREPCRGGSECKVCQRYDAANVATCAGCGSREIFTHMRGWTQ